MDSGFRRGDSIFTDVPDSQTATNDKELRALVERALGTHYELDCEIGRGGMGVVYRAHDRRLKRPVAIKVLPPELGFRSEIRQRFLKEAETAAQLSHPNIVPIYSVDERDNLVFFVMACVDGQNVAQLLHANGPFDFDSARLILREVAEALDYAHDRGVIHRDIKPDNIIIDESGQPMVTDFGIARAVTDTDSRLTATGIAIGTPAFMSPEQAVGERELDARSDLYSLGIVGYQMLCGELPFTATNTPAMLMKHISEPPRRLEARRSNVPPDLSRAVMMLLEKDPGRRYQSASALVAALRGEPVDQSVVAAASTRMEPQNASRRAAQLQDSEDEWQPTEEDMDRWEVPKVKRFRRMMAYFIPINVVVIVFALFTGADVLSISFVYSIYMAYQYANLWSEGYDWRDVFKQPKQRTLMHMASETIDRLEMLSDPKSRKELRERERRRMRGDKG